MATPEVTFANATNANTTFTMPANSVTVTANFETIPAVTYAVTVSSAGSGVTGDGNYEAGATVNINAGTPPAGQQFKYWTATPEVTFANATSANTTFTMPSNAVTVTAQWEIINYTITYVLNGGTNHAGNPVTYTIESTTINLQNPTRNGYTFAGWAEGSSIATGSTGNKTFTAQWEIINYTISYILNGGTNHAGNPATYTIESPAITLQNPTRDGYTFAGWVEGNVIVSGSTGNKTFTAQWTTIPIITIDAHPATITNVTAGSIMGSLTVAASVTQGAMLSYQWYSSTENSNEGGTSISGADGSTFSIPATLTAGMYFYFCEVRAAGATSVRTNVAMIIVNPQQITSAEISDTPLARVYPNPTDGTVILEFEADDVYILTLADMTGKALMRQTVKGQRVQVDMGDYPSGVYLLTIDDGKRQTVVRVVKN